MKLNYGHSLGGRMPDSEQPAKPTGNNRQDRRRTAGRTSVEQPAKPTCSICGELFREGETVVKYRTWPQLEKLCHVACAIALTKEAELTE